MFVLFLHGHTKVAGVLVTRRQHEKCQRRCPTVKLREHYIHIYLWVFFFFKKKHSFHLRKMPERTAEDRTNTKWIYPHHRRVSFKLFKLKLGMKLGAQTRDSQKERERAFLISRRDFSCRMACSLLPLHLCEVFGIIGQRFSVFCGNNGSCVRSPSKQCIRACCHHILKC